MKKIIIFVLSLVFSIVVNAQVLDSIELSQAYEYTSLEEALVEPEKVIVLTLKRDKLSEIPSEIYQFTNLQVLNLSKNKITEIPEEINQLTLLQELYLFNNQVKVLSPSLGELENLRVLDLSKNPLSELPKEISTLKNLERLILWSTEVTEFPYSITHLSETLLFLDLRVVFMNQERQNAIMDLLPNTKIMFSSSCNCN
jgi:Leucine-rich repeat (LRR) protein